MDLTSRLRQSSIKRLEAQNALALNAASVTPAAPSQSPWLTQTVWGINPTTGNDNGPGTLVAPLKTWAQFIKRFSGMSVINPVTVSVQVTITGDLPANDPIQGEFWLANAVEIDVTSVMTQQAAGTFTAFTALNRTAPGTEPAVTDTNNAANFGAGNVNFLVVDTTVGARSWIDASLGGGQANVGQMMSTQAIGGSPLTAPAVNAFVNGDTYTIQRPGQVTFGSIRVHGVAFATQFPSVRFFNVWSQAGNVLPYMYTDGTAILRFNESRFDSAVFMAGAAGAFSPVIFANCLFVVGTQISSTSSVQFLGGLSKGTHFLNGPCQGTYDGDHILRARVQPANGATALFGNVGSLGTQTNLVACQGPKCTVRHQTGSYGSSIAWGNPTNYVTAGVAGNGLRIYYANGAFATQLGQLPGTALVTFPAPTTTASPLFNPATAAWAISPGASALTLIGTSIAGSGYGSAMNDPITDCMLGPGD